MTISGAILLQLLLAQAQVLVATQGPKALDATERALTVPESDLRKLLKGYKMTDEAIDHAVQLGHTFADAGSDFLVFMASHGVILPD